MMKSVGKTTGLLGLTTGCCCLWAVDWPNYRGPNHDATSTETIRLNWTQQPPKTLWKVPISAGLSSLSIRGGRVFTQGLRQVANVDTEFCIALDANDGRELWSVPVGPGRYDGGVGTDDGPRSTPSVEGERVYVLSSRLLLHCLNATNGATIWSKDLRMEYEAQVIAWQNAASPLLVDDLVVLNANGRAGERLIAFRKSDGSEAWKGQSDGLTHATPVLATIAGTRQAVFLAQSGLVSVLPEDGTVLWRFPLNYNFTSVAASPVVFGDHVYISRAYPGSLSRAQAGAVVVRVSGSGASLTASQLWSKVNQLMNHWATPVHHAGHIYGVFGQGDLSVRCVVAETGAEKWSQPGVGYGSVSLVQGRLLVLHADGTLVLAETNPEAYTELARIQPLIGKCWNNPAISDGRIYLRSTLEVAALDVAVDQPLHPLKLEMALTASGQLQLFAGVQNGSAMETNRLAHISVYATSDLATPVSSWLRLTESTVVRDGKLLLENPEGGNQARRFFITREEP